MAKREDPDPEIKVESDNEELAPRTQRQHLPRKSKDTANLRILIGDTNDLDSEEEVQLKKSIRLHNEYRQKARR